MRSVEERLAELETLWHERGIAATDLAVDDGGTVVDPRGGGDAATWSAVIRDLPRASGERVPLVVLGEELGRGAMGIVRVGHQRSLGREVAVKAPLDETDVAATRALLREAWVSGQLEHPNVVPVHALYRGEATPLLLMKRIEGSDWSLDLRDRSALQAHLRTLTQVCHAVHFAHTRGILHLDLKPSNVMLGSYGEIYLVDWGIAVCNRDDLPDIIPRARDIRSVLGTPAYMAPELAAGDGSRIDPRTDVYLLGSMLHEILTGRPPHQKDTLIQSVLSAFTADPPTFEEDVPPELAAICTRALSREPDDRYASAADLREALEEYLVHIDSLQLSAAAQAPRARVLELLDAGADEADELDRLAGEAEFGFRQALHVWPDNAIASDALQDLLERLVERDLAEGNGSAAKRRLQNLPRARPDLERRAEQLRTESDEESRELAKLRHDTDLGIYSDARSKMAYLGAMLWGGSMVTLGLLGHLDLFHPDHLTLLIVTAVGTGVFAAMVYAFRRQVFANQVNQNIIALLTVGFLMGDLYWIGMVATQPPFEAAAVGIGPISVFVIAAHAASFDRRLVLHAVVAMAGISTTFLAPEHALELIGATGIVVLLMLGRTWAKPPERKGAGPP